MPRSEVDRRQKQLETLRKMLQDAHDNDEPARWERIRAGIRETEIRLSDLRKERRDRTTGEPVGERG